MPHKRQILLVALILVAPAIAASPADQLQINGQLFPMTLVDAYGKATLNTYKYCPPVSNRFVLDKFVRDVLTAREAEADEIAERDTALTNDIQPLEDDKRKINVFLETQKRNSIIASVYKRQLSRIEAEIAVVTLDANKRLERRTEFRIRSDDRFGRLENISDADKQSLGRTEAMANIYATRLSEAIPDEAIKQRYDQLVKEKDNRFVNVYLFEHRSAVVVAIDEDTITKVTEFLRSKLAIDDFKGGHPPNMKITPWDYQGYSSWSRPDQFLDAAQNKPELITAGSTLISAPTENESSYTGVIYKVSYIFSKSFYPLVDLHEKLPGVRQASSTIKAELFESRLEADINELRANAQVSINGKILTESTNYAACPRQ